MNLMRTLVVDDEPSAREGVARIIENHPSLELCGYAHSISTLEAQYKQHEPDLIILDIMLRHHNSLKFFKSLAHCPLLIITTAFDQHALSGFSLKAVDYLLKPISQTKLEDAIERAEKLFSKPVPNQESFYIRCDGRYVTIQYKEILYIKGLQNYVVINTDRGKYVTKTTLKSLWNHLDSAQFIQIHRSYIVRIRRIEQFDSSSIYIGPNELPLSRGYKEMVLKKILKD